MAISLGMVTAEDQQETSSEETNSPEVSFFKGNDSAPALPLAMRRVAPLDISATPPSIQSFKFAHIKAFSGRIYAGRLIFWPLAGYRRNLLAFVVGGFGHEGA
jgi:hypothetical protein